MIDIYDLDKQLIGKDKRDFMCRCIIPMKEASLKIVSKATDDGKPHAPTWHKCYFKRGQKACGEILLSFMVSDRSDYAPNPNVKMMGILNDAADRNAVV